MKTPNPDYPRIVLAFDYRGFTIEIDRGQDNGTAVYAAWVSYATGCRIAEPHAPTPRLAIKRAKRWVDAKLTQTEDP